MDKSPVMSPIGFLKGAFETSFCLVQPGMLQMGQMGRPGSQLEHGHVRSATPQVSYWSFTG